MLRGGETYMHGDALMACGLVVKALLGLLCYFVISIRLLDERGAWGGGDVRG